jgi:DNA helicase-2/ATP-dependent DNA helicase PcrA
MTNTIREQMPLLNDAQWEALQDESKSILVVAGAGTGKTRVLTARIAYLLLTEQAYPEQILAVTFSNKAAREMSDRIGNLLPFALQPTAIGTFHSLSVRFLREFGHEIGIESNFVIYDTDDQRQLMKTVLKDLNLDVTRFVPKSLLWDIEGFKNDLLDPVEHAETEVLAKIYGAYQNALRANNALDFTDLLYFTTKLFKNSKETLSILRERFQHILVDEYQDTNAVQKEMTDLLKGENNTLFVVGDEDQSIYGWRGAQVENILKFDKTYDAATIHKLEENYRCTKSILEVANSVIANNIGRRGKTLWTSNEQGDLVRYRSFGAERDEADFIVRQGALLCEKHGLPYNETAVFYRTNAQSRVIEEAAIRHRIPYQIIGGLRFYERKEIKDTLAYLRFLHNPKDTLSFKRLIKAVPRGIGGKTVEKIIELSCRSDMGSIEKALAAQTEYKGATQKKVGVLANLVGKLRDIIGDALPLAKRVELILLESGYLEFLKNQATQEAENRIDNLYELLTSIEEFVRFNTDADLDEFLQHVSLLSDVDGMKDKKQGMILMTLHASKGLEFQNVFISGFEENLFPHSRSVTSPDEIEEERRLCYVGMTRAKNRLHLTSAVARKIYGSVQYNTPSRFLSEIPENLLDIKNQPGYANHHSNWKDNQENGW